MVARTFFNFFQKFRSVTTVHWARFEDVKPVALDEQSGKLSKPSKKQASKKINKTTIPAAKDKKKSAGRFFFFSRTD
jgi:hypothetical protein